MFHIRIEPLHWLARIQGSVCMSAKVTHFSTSTRTVGQIWLDCPIAINTRDANSTTGASDWNILEICCYSAPAFSPRQLLSVPELPLVPSSSHLPGSFHMFPCPAKSLHAVQKGFFHASSMPVPCMLNVPFREAEVKLERLRCRCFFTELVRAVQVNVLSLIVTDTDLAANW